MNAITNKFSKAVLMSELRFRKQLAKIHLSEMKKKNSYYINSDYVYSTINSDPEKEYKKAIMKIAELTISLNCKN